MAKNRKAIDSAALSGLVFLAAVSLLGCKFTDMIHDGAMRPDELVDLGAVIAGEVQGRRTDNEIVLMSFGAMPVEDVAWATTLYRNAIERNIGTTLNLWERPVLA